MKHLTNLKVYYADTDAYGVAWHGTYARWFEIGRTEFCEILGVHLDELQAQNVVFPVINLNISYKIPARLNDEIIIETSIEKMSATVCTFVQTIKNKLTGNVNAVAKVDIVAVDCNGKLYRRIPAEIKEIFEGAYECKD
ncbi:MAG: acyl-CoA thioesterase [bacterium]|nr:acyl-CoA thioesterase [bacterium]